LFKQLLFLSILIFIPPISSAQLADHTFETSIEEGQLYIIAQIQIRDSNQNLVGYIETDRITVEDLQELSIVLDDMSKNPEYTKIVIIDDTKYQVITGVGDAKFLSDKLVSRSAITNDGKPLAYANYDGFPIKTGDSAITTWTMIRPA
jgi:hypothetical protein|tara:strand:- start:211 stop:654 length:444 start_codon:yes stop_codon:yes gene_type:complete